jgi:hypothetical protein
VGASRARRRRACVALSSAALLHFEPAASFRA